MKKAVAVLIAILAFALLATGCARRIRDRIGDKIAESIMEDMTGGAVDISKDGDGITIKTEDGTYVSGDSVDWPGDAMGDLPKPKATITGVMNVGGSGCSVVFTEMSKAEADGYVQAMKNLGYTENPVDMTSTDGIYYFGSNAAGDSATFSYNNGSEDGMISFTPAQQ